MSERQFRASPIYWALAGLVIVLALLLVWELMRTPSWGAAFFLLIMAAIALWSVNTALSRVQLSTTTLCLAAPLRGRRCVELRQLASVVEGGRMIPMVAIIYHPRLENGLLDLDQVHSLTLPSLQEQSELLAALQKEMP
ncbi:MAG TPA: hypothetical protein PKE45_18420 [Caldilineaceae bacterium]|mgnify:CR=1 FL=1|nr:hypothetical protein [Caldilineaceae bacterium]